MTTSIRLPCFCSARCTPPTTRWPTNLAGTVHGGVQAGTAGTRTPTAQQSAENDNFSGEYLSRYDQRQRRADPRALSHLQSRISPLRNSGVEQSAGRRGSIAGQTRACPDSTVDRGARRSRSHAEPVGAQLARHRRSASPCPPASASASTSSSPAHSTTVCRSPSPQLLPATSIAPTLGDDRVLRGTVRRRRLRAAGLARPASPADLRTGQYGGQVTTTVLLFDRGRRSLRRSVQGRLQPERDRPLRLIRQHRTSHASSALPASRPAWACGSRHAWPRHHDVLRTTRRELSHAPQSWLQHQRHA